ncbi:hypothetical protein TNIN_291661 [Trichonephila inaurata madagascariensis]|uniref:Uncharacterized protein n=1 Tax=Trichonephila inaurata madagascariensis TaxID=2747483 RepID=A0A8X6J2W8_9ARAC|nr:hypothetical protein TNIN_291661 [Trichonephila inaurata madagascariensis]
MSGGPPRRRRGKNASLFVKRRYYVTTQICCPFQFPPPPSVPARCFGFEPLFLFLLGTHMEKKHTGVCWCSSKEYVP